MNLGSNSIDCRFNSAVKKLHDQHQKTGAIKIARSRPLSPAQKATDTRTIDITHSRRKATEVFQAATKPAIEYSNAVLRPSNIALRQLMVSGPHGSDQIPCYHNQLFSICANRPNFKKRRHKIFTSKDKLLTFGIQPPLPAT